jgi:hypothetical protein
MWIGPSTGEFLTEFPTEQAVLKVLYLAGRNLEYRRPTDGIRTSGWKQAMLASTALLPAFPPVISRPDLSGKVFCAAPYAAVMRR